MKEFESEQKRPENPGVFDFRTMGEEELIAKLNDLIQCEPNYITRFQAAKTLVALRNSGITGGKDAYFLQAQKQAFVYVELGDGIANFNQVLAAVIIEMRPDIFTRESEAE